MIFMAVTVVFCLFALLGYVYYDSHKDDDDTPDCKP